MVNIRKLKYEGESFRGFSSKNKIKSYYSCDYGIDFSHVMLYVSSKKINGNINILTNKYTGQVDDYNYWPKKKSL